MKFWDLVLLSTLVGPASVQAACNQPGQDSRIIYGGQQPDNERKLTMVCNEAVHSSSKMSAPAGATAVRKPAKAAPRWEALDPESMFGILSRELEQTEAELMLARRQDDDKSDPMRHRIHRLQKDIEALQSEISRLQKR